MGRPKTTDVVSRMIEANNEVLLRKIASMMGGTPDRVEALPTTSGTLPTNATPRTRVQVGKREKVERIPEGGYADRYVVVPANAGGEALPKGVSNEILEANYNIYFYRNSDGESVAPHPQARALLKAARFTYAGTFKRWYGRKSELPKEFASGVRSKRA